MEENLFVYRYSSTGKLFYSSLCAALLTKGDRRPERHPEWKMNTHTHTHTSIRVNTSESRMPFGGFVNT